MSGPEVSKDQLGAIMHGLASEERFERIALAAGPRALPDWVRGAHIDWMDAYGNSPHLKVRCRRDPSAFARAGNPVWEKVGAKTWIAEQDGIAEVHYHDGQVAVRPFVERVGWIDGKWNPALHDTLDGQLRVDRAGCWPDQPGRPCMGGGIYETIQRLATTRQEGYGGRHFDITLKSGDAVRLIGPWHGGAPEGFTEVYYYIDKPEDARRGRGWRPWYNRGGYFGLYVRTTLLLDIFATYLPHVGWAEVTKVTRSGDLTYLEPLRPETSLPKGWHVDPADCPGHRFGVTNYQSGPLPSDQCAFCEQRRDPSWVSPYARAAA